MDPAASAPDDALFARGCDLASVPLAADIPPADLKTLLGVDTSNPFLRQLRIEQGFLNSANLPPDLLNVVPFKGIDEPPPVQGDLK